MKGKSAFRFFVILKCFMLRARYKKFVKILNDIRLANPITEDIKPKQVLRTYMHTIHKASTQSFKLIGNHLPKPALNSLKLIWHTPESTFKRDSQCFSLNVVLRWRLV